MKLCETIEEIDKNKHLIGQIINGAILDELVPIPLNELDQDVFLKEYVNTLDINHALNYVNTDDFGIYGIFDKEKIVRLGVFVYMSLNEILDKIKLQ